MPLAAPLLVVALDEVDVAPPDALVVLVVLVVLVGVRPMRTCIGIHRVGLVDVVRFVFGVFGHHGVLAVGPSDGRSSSWWEG